MAIFADPNLDHVMSVFLANECLCSQRFSSFPFDFTEILGGDGLKNKL